jgi:malate dehydrogenase (oxaloacetate-decarboxylating)
MSEEQLKIDALEYHEFPTPGKISIAPTKALANQRDLSLAYSPGVAYACTAIQENPELAARYTARANLVAVITNGTAVLGLGNIGALAGKPVMEGKGCLFKKFAGIDVFDIEINEMDPDKIVDVVAALEPTFGGINLEDIKAPECFYIERKLRERMKIPVFHDDQHGTAIVVLAALLNSLRLTGQRLEEIRIVVVGMGAAGVAVTRILLAAGAQHIIGCDSRGALSAGREDCLDGTMGAVKRELSMVTNLDRRAGGVSEVIEGADLFIGLSGARVMPASALAAMNPDPIVFAMANPDPEVAPEEAARYARVVATGRSDYPNQINNVLAFPGVFRGALDVRATQITERMKTAAARAIADIVTVDELREDYIIPSVFNREVVGAVASAVAEEARESGTAEAGNEMGFASTEEMRLLPGR